ncbi:MAG: transcription antitermination factor NusB [Dehalococcoidia bacterium]
MAGARRRGRIAALQVLYELDCTGHDWTATLERSMVEGRLPEEAKELARELVQGVVRDRERIDALIQEHAPAWPVDQLSVVGRNILRIAIFEIVLNNKTPPKAAINEAVELAKTFGSESLHRFVNGVLGSIMATART